MNEKVYGPYKSLREMLDEMDNSKKNFKQKNPIGYFLKYHVWYPLYRFFVNEVFMWHKEVKWFWQRGCRGWSDRDLWGFDSYLASVIHPALLKLKKIQHILPMWESGMTEAEAQARWDSVLDDMIFAFKMWDECTNGNSNFWMEGKNSKHILEGGDWVKRYPDYHLMTKEEDARMRKGMQLFITHFGALWD